ncbi:ATP-binding protein [uncultured Adlercreutzia sp.]|uniref:sensor histidine kinase n=1 Tax=uncultured Adlercreutzia sp. TaxID=875803 RepID=UPI00267750A3|nr:ATP-binding protein [uncultured Adlercreutzia sp.]
MALKSEQARVLRRRVLGGLIRNLVLFTGGFALFCAAAQAFVVPAVANYVADSTSSWRALPSSEQFQQIMADQGFLQNPDLFDIWVAESADAGYSTEAGSAANIRDELNELQDAIAEYASLAANPETAEAADEIARKKAEELGLVEDVADASANGAAAGEVPADGNDELAVHVEGYGDAGTAEEGTGGNEADFTADSPIGDTPVPLVSYETILASEDIDPTQASAAQARAALRVSASLQELGLHLSVPSALMPPDTTEQTATKILVAAAVMGYGQADLNVILENAYRQSQEQAFDAWLPLTPAEEAKMLGINDEHPVWQITQAENGAYSMRDVSFYTFVKSFKLPLVAVSFVAGWLFIIFRSLNKSLRYFDELSGAVGTLLADKEAPIELPPDLSIARNELTVIRSQSLADERAAHAAEQRKNELVAYLAHDIRTPLTSVLGYLDLLRETTDLPRDTLRKYADIAYTKAERLEQLINEFFEITRYNLSAIPIERETVGVRLFCQQVAEAFFPEATARNIRISIDVAGADTFFVDPDKLARALGNVLRNAVAYADANSTIALAARQDAHFTTITVANRGREISEAHLESIFEKFYRADGARTTRSGGAGLGLAIAREIVVAHQGDIEAASEHGITVFTLRIPTRGEAGAPDVLTGSGATGALSRPPLNAAPETGRRAGRTASPRTSAAQAGRGSRAASERASVPARTSGERAVPRRSGTAPLKPRYTAGPSAPTASRMNDNRPRSRSRHARRQP